MQRLLKERGDMLQQAVLQQSDTETQYAVLGHRVANQTSPLGQLPYEVLLPIFKFAIGGGSTDSDARPEILMHVNHQWRSLVRSEFGAVLWTTCRVSAASSSREESKIISSLQMYLSLSRNHHLRLQFSFPDNTENGTRSDFDLGMAMMHKHLHRVESINLVRPSGNISDCPSIPGPTPSLRRLQLIGSRLDLLNPILSGNAPLLTKASVIITDTDGYSDHESVGLRAYLSVHFKSLTHLD